MQTNSPTSASLHTFTKWRKVLVKFLIEDSRYKLKKYSFSSVAQSCPTLGIKYSLGHLTLGICELSDFQVLLIYPNPEDWKDTKHARQLPVLVSFCVCVRVCVRACVCVCARTLSLFLSVPACWPLKDMENPFSGRIQDMEVVNSCQSLFFCYPWMFCSIPSIPISCLCKTEICDVGFLLSSFLGLQDRARMPWPGFS